MCIATTNVQIVYLCTLVRLQNKYNFNSFVVRELLFSNFILGNNLGMLVKSSVECQEGEFASHSGDCNKYLQCLWGKFKVNSCPAGLYWNNVLFK